MAEMKNVQEYLNTGVGTAGSLLIPTKIYDRLIMEVDKVLIPRSEAALYLGPADIPGSSVSVDLEQENKMNIRPIGEGGDIILDQDQYEEVTFTPDKYGLGIRITSELMEDSKWNLLEMNIRKAGKRFGENETSLILTALQACTNNVSGGAAITIPNITRAMQYLEDADYEATSFLIGNEVLNDLRNIDTFVEYQKIGNTEMLTKGFVGTIYGMNVLKFSTNAAPSTTYSKYSYVYDKNEAYGIAEKRTLTVEKFNLSSHDMSAASITQRIQVKLLRDNAVARILTS